MYRTVLRRLCAALILLAAAASPAISEDIETKRFGDEGGTPFVAACPDGKAAIGFYYRWATYNLSSIVPQCQDINEKGELSGETSAGVLQGVDTKYRGEIFCDKGGYLNRLLVHLTGAGTVQAIAPQCFNVKVGPSQTKPRRTDYNGPMGKEFDAFCGSYEAYAYAIVGTFTSKGSNPGINSIGLLCRTRGGDQGGGGGNDVGGNDDGGNDGGGNAGGGGGDEMTIDAAVTGYSQPGGNGNEVCYFDEDDTVEIVKQDDNDPTWVMVKGTSGNCDGKRVWVYNDGKLR